MLDRRAVWIVAALSSLPLYACSSGDSGAGGANGSGGAGGGGGSPLVPDANFQYCEKQHAGQNELKRTVILCDEMFSTRPYVHLPADDLTSPTATVYVALETLGPGDSAALNLIDRRGKAYVATEAKGKDFSTDYPPVPWPAGLEGPSSRGMFTVYGVTGTVGTFTSKPDSYPAFAVADAAPQVLIPGKVIDTRSERAWEGTIAAREVNGGVASWDSKKPQALRIEFTSMAKGKDMTDGEDPQESLTDGATYTLTGRIANLNESVTASTGDCLPAFSSLGESNSFYGAKNDVVSLNRLGQMHGWGDEELVLVYPKNVGFGVTGMSLGAPSVVNPVDFIQLSDKSSYDSVEINPHGVGFGNVILMHPVMGDDLGGKSCTPQ